ncbi:MAG: DUF6526 family protein [Candidatus Hydrogenedentes bacterium]|nr:DUF6526 family protein [Candidatus Hydrogenedentota bacterium]
MSAEPVQNYANHRTYDPQLVIIGILCLLAIIASLVTIPVLSKLTVTFLAIAVVMVVLRMRRYATRLQDRIIRMEMGQRLERVLPDSIAARARELELGQIIGLRFASDAELPALVEKVLANKSMRSKDIKQLVTNWQADHLRV